MRRVSWLLIALLGVAMAACDRPADTPNRVTLDEVVRTTSAPVDALTRQLVGDAVPVELLCPESEDPATWRPDPETVALFQRARLIVANGAGYEKWVAPAPLPRSRLVEAADALSRSFIMVEGEAHSHGPEGYHTHEVVLGHVWLDPLHAIAQAEEITEALVGAFPEHEGVFEFGLSVLRVKDVRSL